MQKLSVVLLLGLVVLVSRVASNAPVLFAEYDEAQRNTTLYRLDNLDQSRFDIKSVGSLPDVKASSGVTACNSKTCYIVSPFATVVYGINLNDSAVSQLSVPLAPQPYIASAAATEDTLFVSTATNTSRGRNVVAAVRLSDGKSTWSASPDYPPVAVIPVFGTDLLVVSDGGLTSDARARYILVEMYDLFSSRPAWSGKYFTNGPEEVVTATVDAASMTLFVVQQRFNETDWNNRLQTITTFSVPRTTQPVVTLDIPHLQGTKLIPPLLFNGTQVLMFGQYPSDNMVNVYAYEVQPGESVSLIKSLLLPGSLQWSGASMRPN